MYKEIFKQRYEQYYIQNAETGDLKLTTRSECFDFANCESRIPFYAPEGSSIVVRLANNELGRNIERACWRDVWVFQKRKQRGLEPPTDSIEDCRDKNGENFAYDIPDRYTNISERAEEDAYRDFLKRRLTTEEFDILMACRNGFTIAEYARDMMAKYPGEKENTLYRRCKRMWDKLEPKALKLRSEWDNQ